MSPALFRYTAFFACAFAISACGGGSSTPNTRPSGNPIATPTGQPTRAPAPSSLPAAAYVYENINALGGGNGEIDVFSAGSVNAATPRKVSSASLYPYGGTLAWGPAGSLFATGNTDAGDLVVEYSAAQLSAGNAPTTVINSFYLPPLSNPNLLLLIESLAVDSHGDVFVVGTPNGFPSVYSVYEYPAGFSPTTTPTKISAPGVTAPTLVRIDSSDNLYVVNSPSTGTASILVFAAANPSSAPLRTIGGTNSGFSSVTSLAVGPDGTLTTFDGTTNEVYVFAPGASGNASPQTVFQSSALNWAQSPIAVDSNNNVYGAQFVIAGSSVTYNLVAFPAGAAGVKSPLFSMQSATLAPTDILFAP